MPLPYPPYGTLNFFDQTAQDTSSTASSRTAARRSCPQQTGPVIDVLYSAAGNSADEAYYSNGIIGYDFEIGATNYYIDPATGVEATCGAGQQPPFGDSTNDCLDNEGFHEAMEFASGNYGLLQSALDVRATTRRRRSSTATGNVGRQRARRTSASRATRRPRSTTRLDGSTPTTASTEWKPTGARAAAAGLDRRRATLKWIAVDFKGNHPR